VVIGNVSNAKEHALAPYATPFWERKPAPLRRIGAHMPIHPAPIRLPQGAAICGQFFSALPILSSIPFLKSFKAPWLPQI
jgi:hypothetical protein